MTVSGIIFSNLHDKNIPELTRQRTMASVPFACRYRLIDFALSNMVNSGITDVRVITHNNYRSLMDHLGSGKDWDLARRSGGLKILPPFVSSYSGGENLYRSRLEALFGVISSIQHIHSDYIVMSDCDSICNIDLKDMVNKHIESGATLTLGVKDTVFEDRHLKNVNVIYADKDGNVTDIERDPRHATGVKSLGLNVMVVNTNDLKSLLNDASAHGYSSFINDVVRRNVGKYVFKVYRYDGVFRNIYSMKEYYDCNMQLLRDERFRKELIGNPLRPILTKVHNSAPTKYSDGAVVKNSLIADGCIIKGTVENSIIFRGVKIGRGTVVKNSIIFQDTYTGENVFLNCVITDKDALIQDGRMLSGHETLPFYIEKGQIV